MSAHKRRPALSDAQRAVWSGAHQNDLPDSCFAYIEGGGSKDADGKTTPRSKRHLPYKKADGSIDVPHLRNALARLDQTSISAEGKAAAKRKLVAAARQAGVGDYGNENSGSDRTVAPTVIRNDVAVVRLAIPSAIRIVDEDNWIIEVCSTSEAVDSFGTIFDYDASKDAFRRWINGPANIREMHQGVAVGKAIGIREDDETRKIYTRMRISKGAPNTWEKIKDRTLDGSSVGAANVRWIERRMDDTNRKVASYYDLVELSLVDNASNPDAQGITVIRAAQPDMTILDCIEETSSMSTPSAPSVSTAVVRATQPDSVISDAIDAALAQRRANAAEYTRIRVAGERAEGTERRDRPQQQGERHEEFIARLALTRGRAEAHEMAAIAEEKRATPPQQATVPVMASTATPTVSREASSGVTTETGYQGYEMDGAQGHLDAHTHDHRHRHTDGTIHQHPHVHDHASHTHRVNESDATPHADHYHVYREGRVYDARLMTAETERLPKSQAGQGATMPAGAKSSSVFEESPPSNPVKHIKPSMTGHRVDYNTEDASAKDFGIPDPVEDRPTPGEDGETLEAPPDMFHEGGEWPDAAKLTGGTYDEDGDHDDGSDTPIIASRPPAASAINPKTMRPTPGNPSSRATEAETTRQGARISALDRDAMHDNWRDAAMQNVVSACEHCSCPQCKAILVLLTPDADGDYDGDEDEDEGAMRVSLASITRGQAQVMATIAELASITQAVLDFVGDQANVAQRLSDLEATLTDTQRLASAETTRAVTTQQQQVAELTRAAADIHQLVKATASSVEGLDARVARIEATPLPGGPASAPLAEIKRIATDPRGVGNVPSETRVQAITDFVREFTANHPNDPHTHALQMEAFAQVFNATVPPR